MRLEDVYESLDVALGRIGDDMTLFNLYVSFRLQDNVCVESLETAASNHLFDDNADQLGIDKIDGHRIRAYFQRSGVRPQTYELVHELHAAFDLSRESGEFMEYVNKMRERDGLQLLSVE